LSLTWTEEDSEDQNENFNGLLKPSATQQKKTQSYPNSSCTTNSTIEVEEGDRERAHSLAVPATDGLSQVLNGELRRLIKGRRKSMHADAKSWVHSFETLLADAHGVEVFRLFLRCEYSEENMIFWCACEELKRTRSFRIGPRVKRIFKMFIEDGAPQEVNLNYDTKREIREAMRSPTRAMFDVAQKKVREMISADAYPRFLRSDVYRAVLEITT